MMDERDRCARGFTLAEAMIVIGLIALLAGFVAPNIRDYRIRSRLVTPSRNIEQLSVMARLQAINSRRQGVVVFHRDDATDEFTSTVYGPVSAALVFLDDDADGFFDTTERVISSTKLEPPIEFSKPGTGGPFVPTGTDRVIYNSGGGISNVTGARIEVYLGDMRGNHMRLLFSPSGQVRREKNMAKTGGWLPTTEEGRWEWLY